jgi:hypothetical protein
MEAPSPFREEDLPARIEALRRQADELRSRLAQVQLETAGLTPWSWKKFFLGLVLLPVSVAGFVLVFVAR